MAASCGPIKSARQRSPWIPPIRWWALAVVVMLCATAAWGTEESGVRVAVTIEPQSPHLADDVWMRVTVRHDADRRVEPPVFGDQVGGFRVVSVERALPRIEDDVVVLEVRLLLAPPGSGEHEIPPVVVRHAVRGEGTWRTATTEPMMVTVSSTWPTGVDGTAESFAALRGLSVTSEDDKSHHRWLWLAGGALLVAMLSAGWWIARRRPRAVPELTPREQAAYDLEQLLTGRTDMAPRQFFADLSNILRRYIERSTGIHAPEQTTEEFLRELGGTDVFVQYDLGGLRAFLETADLVKFAGRQPDLQTIDRAIEQVRALIERSSPATGEASS